MACVNTEALLQLLQDLLKRLGPFGNGTAVLLVPLTKKLLKKACLGERLRFASKKKKKCLQRKDTVHKSNINILRGQVKDDE